MRLVSELIRIDTSNPPGNEEAAVQLPRGRVEEGGHKVRDLPGHTGPGEHTGAAARQAERRARGAPRPSRCGAGIGRGLGRAALQRGRAGRLRLWQGCHRHEVAGDLPPACLRGTGARGYRARERRDFSGHRRRGSGRKSRGRAYAGQGGGSIRCILCVERRWMYHRRGWSDSCPGFRSRKKDMPVHDQGDGYRRPRIHAHQG